MTWTYGQGGQTTKDQVRLVLGDTDSADQQIQDEEIKVFLPGGALAEANVWMAAAAAADAIAARYARAVDKGVGPFRLQAAAKQSHYRTLAEDLRKRRGRVYQMPSAGGVSVTDKQTLEDDTDRLPGYYKIGMQEHPAARDRSVQGGPDQDTEGPEIP